MNLEEAKEFLNGCTRSELRDHAFGDTEVYWMLNGEDVAGGYFGAGKAEVWFENPDQVGFTGSDAQELRRCGSTGSIERNDETGPDEYQEGVTMPGLTLEGVLQELTTRPE